MISLFVRAEADQATGIGHVMRCLALAQAWKRRGGCVHFVTGCKNPMILETILDQGFGMLSPGEARPQGNRLEKGLASLWSSFEDDHSCVVLDGYRFGLEYQKDVRACSKRLLVIDDYAHLPRYEADFLLNHNIQAEKLQYRANEQCVFLLGPRYALLRQEFFDAKQARETPSVAGRLLVTLGGSDPEKVTFKVMAGLSGLKLPEMEIRILAGPANPCAEELKRAAAKSGLRCEIVEASKQMPQLIGWADLAITAGGSTCMELAYMGVPFLVVALAENQKQVMSGFANKGAAVALGWHADLEPSTLAREIDSLARDRSRRSSFAKLGQTLVDGAGARRVAEMLDPTSITLDSVQENDCKTLWNWANDPHTRAVSFSSKPIPWEDHLRWFTEKLHSNDCVLYKATNQHGVPLGLARFDLGQGGPVISVNLDPDFRSLGLGSELIHIATERVMREKNPGKVDALIKKENAASVKAFIKAGYEKVGEEMREASAVVRMSYGGKKRV